MDYERTTYRGDSYAIRNNLRLIDEETDAYYSNRGGVAGLVRGAWAYRYELVIGLILTYTLDLYLFS